MMSTRLEKLSRIIFIISFIALSPTQAQSKLRTKLVTKICLKGFKAEMKFARKTPPKNMDVFTCECFIKKISSGSGIVNAHSLCKEEASKKFSL